MIRYVVMPLLGNGNEVLGYDASACSKTCLGRDTNLQLHYRYPSPFSLAFPNSWNHASSPWTLDLQGRIGHECVDVVASVSDSEFVSSIHVEVAQIEVVEVMLLPPWSFEAVDEES